MQKTFEQQIKEIKDSFKARKLTAEETAKIAAIKSVEKDRNITEEAKAEIKLRDATKHSKNAAKQAEEAAKQAAKEADKAKIAANKADADD